MADLNRLNRCVWATTELAQRLYKLDSSGDAKGIATALSVLGPTLYRTAELVRADGFGESKAARETIGNVLLAAENATKEIEEVIAELSARSALSISSLDNGSGSAVEVIHCGGVTHARSRYLQSVIRLLDITLAVVLETRCTTEAMRRSERQLNEHDTDALKNAETGRKRLELLSMAHQDAAAKTNRRYQSWMEYTGGSTSPVSPTFIEPVGSFTKFEDGVAANNHAPTARFNNTPDRSNLPNAQPPSSDPKINSEVKADAPKSPPTAAVQTSAPSSPTEGKRKVNWRQPYVESEMGDDSNAQPCLSQSTRPISQSLVRTDSKSDTRYKANTPHRLSVAARPTAYPTSPKTPSPASPSYRTRPVSDDGRASAPGAPVQSPQARKSLQAQEKEGLGIPWRICTTRHHWDFVDRRVITSSTNSPPPAASSYSDGSSKWTELLATWVSAAALDALGYRFTRIVKDRWNTQKLGFDTVYCVAQILSFAHVEQLVEMTASIYQRSERPRRALEQPQPVSVSKPTTAAAMRPSPSPHRQYHYRNGNYAYSTTSSGTSDSDTGCNASSRHNYSSPSSNPRKWSSTSSTSSSRPRSSTTSSKTKSRRRSSTAATIGRVAGVAALLDEFMM